MTNFKKIGLTALAGTLAATAYAQAGALSVSGTARMEYQSSKTSATASTDSFADNSSLVFSGSGELDNGFTVSMYQTQAGRSDARRDAPGVSVERDAPRSSRRNERSFARTRRSSAASFIACRSEANAGPQPHQIPRFGVHCYANSLTSACPQQVP